MSFASRLHSVCTPITLDAYRICSSPRQSFLQPSRRRPGVFHSSEFSAVPRPFLWNILRWANARNPIMYHSGQCGEFSSQKVAAILGSRLSERSGRACRVCAYTSIALHAARPHSTQACLVFAKSAPRTPKFATRLHAAQLASLEDWA